jgi:threonine/homoserine/homoserine lactone efflux protein
MEFVIAAFIFGLSAGFKPGILSIFVIHETMTRGDRAGFLASLAPFVSDGPIIIGSLLLLNRLANLGNFVALVSLAGACYLVFIAYSISFSGTRKSAHGASPTSFMTAVKINLLNPAPYFFWTTVGSAYLVRANLIEGALFICIMLGTLSLSKFAVAKAIVLLGARFQQHAYPWIMKALALLLLVYAAQLTLQAIDLLSVG